MFAYQQNWDTLSTYIIAQTLVTCFKINRTKFIGMYPVPTILGILACHS